MNGYAVFHDHGSHWAARWLRPGFRHCFAVVRSGEFWIRVDGMHGVPEIEVVAGADYDIASFYEAEGFAVLPVDGDGCPRGLLAVANCVGMVKAVFGLASRALTPWQLYMDLGGSDD